MAFGGAKKGQSKPIRTKPAKSHKLRPATPPKPPSATSGKANLQLRLIAAALVAIPAALIALVIGYLIVGYAA